jgi:hypothetical protein
MIKKIREYFSEHYAYINLQEISDADLTRFMKQPYLADRSFESQMDLLQDHVVSQGLAEVTE